MAPSFPGSTVMIRKSVPGDGPDLVAIWRASVIATHDFLDPSHLDFLDRKVREFLPAADLWVAETREGLRAGFMGLANGHIEALFLDPGFRGMGIGRAFVEFASGFTADLTVDVNEQNRMAVDFYHHLGFEVTGRSDVDDEGLPYPLLHMRRAMAGRES